MDCLIQSYHNGVVRRPPYAFRRELSGIGITKKKKKNQLKQPRDRHTSSSSQEQTDRRRTGCGGDSIRADQETDLFSSPFLSSHISLGINVPNTYVSISPQTKIETIVEADHRRDPPSRTRPPGPLAPLGCHPGFLPPPGRPFLPQLSSGPPTQPPRCQGCHSRTYCPTPSFACTSGNEPGRFNACQNGRVVEQPA